MKALPETVLVEVTEKDIEKGIPSNVCGCPVARALKRALNTSRRVAVGGGTSMIIRGRNKSSKKWYNNGWVDIGLYVGKTPTDCQRIDRFVTKFDDNKVVKPCKFKVRLVVIND